MDLRQARRVPPQCPSSLVPAEPAPSTRLNLSVPTRRRHPATAKDRCFHSRTQTKRISASCPCSGCDRIKPTQTAKSRKIPVCGAKRKPHVPQLTQPDERPGRDCRACPAAREIRPQFGVPFRWLRYPCRFTREPSIYLPPRIANRFGMIEYARISHSRRKASRLTHGRPTGPEPFNC